LRLIVALQLLGFVLAAEARAQTKPAALVSCAPDSVVRSLKGLMASMTFTADSSLVDFLRDSSRSNLGIRAMPVRDPLLCRRADSVYATAVDPGYGVQPSSARAAVVRVGSFYFIYESGAHVVVADRRWEATSVLGFSGD
jgi:hypothetical protein